MNFLIVTNTPHKVNDDGIFAYGPYIKEMNLWLKDIEQVRVVSFCSKIEKRKIELAYENKNVEFIQVPTFNIVSVRNLFSTLLALPAILTIIYSQMKWADHIHLRAPSNMALLGLMLQILFPKKQKTAKYAGNWDPQSKQPKSYKLQQWLLKNTFLTKNMKVLVYGNWPGQTKNIVPFFTASYHETEKEFIHKSLPEVHSKQGNKNILHLLFVGSLSPGKRPLLSIQVAHEMIQQGICIHMDLYGEGIERSKLEEYIQEHHLESQIILHGNQDADTVKAAYKQAHFLIFLSRSEGWPKVIAEAMFWGVLPITTKVSCVEFMIGFGERGKVTTPELVNIIEKVRLYLDHPHEYEISSKKAMEWSRQYTLEKFEQEIKRLIHD